jgi:hypothetical protein
MVALKLLSKWSQPNRRRSESQSVKWRREYLILNLFFFPCLLGPGEALQVVSRHHNLPNNRSLCIRNLDRKILMCLISSF